MNTMKKLLGSSSSPIVVADPALRAIVVIESIIPCLVQIKMVDSTYMRNKELASPEWYMCVRMKILQQR
jgi:hypothetical protein